MAEWHALGNSRLLAVDLPFQSNDEARAWPMALARIEEIIEQEPKLTRANRTSVLLCQQSPKELLKNGAGKILVGAEVVGFSEFDQPDIVLKDFPARQVARFPFDPGLTKDRSFEDLWSIAHEFYLSLGGSCGEEWRIVWDWGDSWPCHMEFWPATTLNESNRLYS
jgi:hypothetical protein